MMPLTFSVNHPIVASYLMNIMKTGPTNDKTLQLLTQQPADAEPYTLPASMIVDPLQRMKAVIRSEEREGKEAGLPTLEIARNIRLAIEVELISAEMGGDDLLVRNLNRALARLAAKEQKILAGMQTAEAVKGVVRLPVTVPVNWGCCIISNVDEGQLERLESESLAFATGLKMVDFPGPDGTTWYLINRDPDSSFDPAQTHVPLQGEIDRLLEENPLADVHIELSSTPITAEAA